MSIEFEAGQSIVTMDRRREDRRDEQGVVKVSRNSGNVDKRKKDRRRQIDPTTCERDYSHDEVEFMTAIDNYKRKTGRMFPTCSEMLTVIASLGYTRIAEVTDTEIEFVAALDQYKKKNARMFPTCSEILEVIRALGYDKPFASACELAAE
jgi:hypothetical protein